MKHITWFVSPKIFDLFRGSILGGWIPTLSRSFPSEKSYSPSRLMCCQEITEPWATTSRNTCRLAAWRPPPKVVPEPAWREPARIQRERIR